MNKVVVNGVDCSPGVVAELRSQLAAAESRAERMKEALREVMEWIAAWDPRFVTDPEWDATQAKVDAALAEVGE